MHSGLAGTAFRLFMPNSIPLAGGAESISSPPAVVPVLKKDTVSHTQSLSAACFADSHILHAANDTSGWGYQWNTGTTGPVMTVNGPGVYWLNYHEPPCTYHTDTFYVSFESFLPALKVTAGCKKTIRMPGHGLQLPPETLLH